MSDYPPNVWTLPQAVAYMEKIFAHPDIRVERFKIEVVSPNGGTMKLTWDREHVGQRRERIFDAHDGPGERDPAFQQSLENALARSK